MASRIEGLPLPITESVEKLLRTSALEQQGERGARLRYMAAEDAEVIRGWLRSEGFLDAVVAIEVEEEKPSRWRVEAGSRWQIGEVLIEPAPPVEVMVPKTGAWFRSEEYETAKVALRGSWIDAGFLQAAFVEAAAYPDHVNKQVRIVWRVAPGKLQRIAEVKVVGANQYRPELARKLSLLNEGDVATSKSIRVAIRNVSNDSHYRSASVVPVLSDASAETVPLRLEVIEADRYDANGTIGYSTDAGIEAGAGWNDHGIGGGLFEYGLHGLWSRTRSGAGMTFSRPVWPGPRSEVGLSLDFVHEDTAGQRFDTITGGPFWLQKFGDLDHVRSKLLQNWITGEGERIRTIEPAISLYLDHRIGEGLPHAGWKGELSLSLPIQTNGTGRWLLGRLDLRSFHSLAKDAVLSPRIGYGQSISLQGTVPKALRQFGGGAGSVRGYALDSLGPTGATGLAEGGLQAVNAGLDLVLKFHDTYLPVLFADVGQVWQTTRSREKPVWSVGFGIIAQTAAGPLRADIAFPQVRRAQDARFQFYISLGEVF